MIVAVFLTIWTVIFPAARGILSFVTPGVTTNVFEELPHLRVTVAPEVAKITAHMEF